MASQVPSTSATPDSSSTSPSRSNDPGRRFRLAVNTGGGDAPGLNAVIRSVVISALNMGWEVFGIQKGYQGLMEEGGLLPLDRSSVEGIAHLGGTILGTTNRGNPLRWPRTLPDGTVEEVDRSGDLIKAFRDHGFDALIAIGGDGSLRIAAELSEKGLPVVGVPKTIDNDLAATQVTFGFHTAVQTASDAIDKLHSTAKAHSRVMVVELMGRHTGWIALFAGLAGSADAILIPEIPFRMDRLCRDLEAKVERGPSYGIVVVAEGSRPEGGEASVVETEAGGEPWRYGGVAERVAQEIQEATGVETRSLVLGHLQRGGQPTAYDRLLALRFGAAAVDLVARTSFGCMVALDPPEVRAVPLRTAVDELKRVPVRGDVVVTARRLGISFGD
ncbi:MAG: ATP-dependent 6-phosphofructokinase [Gemmatimonadales bacterium]|nr:MAG: ATP-dependent 6-phosphofructokinase [Gemmatimonadales bacterium]